MVPVLDCWLHLHTGSRALDTAISSRCWMLSVIFRPWVLGKYNYPSSQGPTFNAYWRYFPSRRDSRDLTTLFSVPHVNIILRYFPSLRYLIFTRWRKQHAYYKTPSKATAPTVLLLFLLLCRIYIEFVKFVNQPSAFYQLWHMRI